MIEKFGPIKNPLTIIAIFAAIVEISGTIVLPFIEKSNQMLYVWFLMVFPTLLVLLFFLTLNFNHKVLYAPSDYTNEDHFVQSLSKASATEKFQKMKAELVEEKSEVFDSTQPGRVPEVSPHQTKPNISYKTLMRRNGLASYILAEELVFQKLASEFSSEIQREVRLGSVGQYMFDGIVCDKGVTTIIEVKVARGGFISSVKKTLLSVQQAVRQLPKKQSSNFRVLLAIVTLGSEAIEKKLALQIEAIAIEFYFPIDVRFFVFDELEREFQVGD